MSITNLLICYCFCLAGLYFCPLMTNANYAWKNFDQKLFPKKRVVGLPLMTQGTEIRSIYSWLTRPICLVQYSARSSQVIVLFPFSPGPSCLKCIRLKREKNHEHQLSLPREKFPSESLRFWFSIFISQFSTCLSLTFRSWWQSRGSTRGWWGNWGRKGSYLCQREHQVNIILPLHIVFVGREIVTPVHIVCLPCLFFE